MQREGGFQYAINLGEVRNGGAEVEKNKFVIAELFYGLKNELTVFSVSLNAELVSVRLPVTMGKFTATSNFVFEYL